MTTFIRGRLTHNQAGAEYEGEVYDRRLALQLPSGHQVNIFDPYPPLSGSLETGTDYEMVVSVLLPHDAVYATSSDALIPADWWHGVVRDTAWRLSGDANTMQREAVSGKSWVLVETEYGSVLIGPSAVAETARANGVETPRAGDTLVWQALRFDLIAVV